jgi:DNA-binding NarL/FixJ family response regulator
VDQLIAAGASGYLVKQTAANELHKAIQEVHRGHNCFSPAVLKRLQERGHEALPGGRIHNGRGRGAKITDRECEVLCLVARGFSNKEAAAELGISIKTIEKHRQQVMNKLNIHEAAGLTRYALAQGLVDRHAPAQRDEEEVKQVSP